MEADRRLSDLLVRTCHDLRAPLRSVRAHAELAMKRGSQAEAAENLAFVVDGACRAEILIAALSRYALALQTTAASFHASDTGALLRAVLAKLRNEVTAAGAAVTYNNLPQVTGNPDRLMEVFENLLRNAIRYRSVAAPAVSITAQEDGGCWRFAVRDNGMGIESDYLEKIFLPFERLDVSENHGPGLGLTIARTIVEHHGGRLWVESAPGAGASFYFTIPQL